MIQEAGSYLYAAGHYVRQGYEQVKKYPLTTGASLAAAAVAAYFFSGRDELPVCLPNEGLTTYSPLNSRDTSSFSPLPRGWFPINSKVPTLDSGLPANIFSEFANAPNEGLASFSPLPEGWFSIGSEFGNKTNEENGVCFELSEEMETSWMKIFSPESLPMRASAFARRLFIAIDPTTILFSLYADIPDIRNGKTSNWKTLTSEIATPYILSFLARWWITNTFQCSSPELYARLDSSPLLKGIRVLAAFQAGLALSPMVWESKK